MDNVAKALELDIPHMSLYSLILENHTVFMNRQRRGNLHLPNEDVESDMFDYILQELEKTASNTTRFPTSPSLVLKATTTSCTGTTPSITDWEQGLQATSTACVIATVPPSSTTSSPSAKRPFSLTRRISQQDRADGRRDVLGLRKKLACPLSDSRKSLVSPLKTATVRWSET